MGLAWMISSALAFEGLKVKQACVVEVFLVWRVQRLRVGEVVTVRGRKNKWDIRGFEAQGLLSRVGVRSENKEKGSRRTEGRLEGVENLACGLDVV